MDVEDAAPEARSTQFESAWSAFDDATRAAERMAITWNDLVTPDLFRTNVHVDDDGNGRVDVLIDEYEGHQLDDLELHARAFIDALMASAREALRATEKIVSGPLGSPQVEHLPLFGAESEFLAFVESGALSGLRPDQIQLIEQFQPYYWADAIKPTHQQFGAVVMRLFGLATPIQREASPLVAFCVQSALPALEVDPPAVVTQLQTYPDGMLVGWHLVATFHVPPGTSPQFTPNIAIDPILNTEPWPDSPDDNMSVQCRQLLRAIEELIVAFERSLGLRAPLNDGHFRLIPAEDDPLWARVDTNDNPDVEAGLAGSDIGLATYRSGDDLIMLIQRPDGVYGRIVPMAGGLDPAANRGAAAEDASRNSAAQWGLPDFVFDPETVQRGSATREVGDGTVICGDRGLAVQVKARTNATTTDDRERAWVAKKAKEGARQASGSVRTVQRRPVAHTNARGRSITVDGNALQWVGVVIIDHDTPPDSVSAYSEKVSIPYVAILRREWDFLFDQLRSTTAVVDYLHRIAGHLVAPGKHATHYYGLALADERTPPDFEQSGIPAALNNPELRTSRPTLPLEPASAADEYGARMYRQILEDIAESRRDGDEADRLFVLHLLDKLYVAERAVVGRLLLTNMSKAPRVDIGTTRWDFRRYLIGETDLHLAYAVCNHFTDRHRYAFKQWGMLRHHEWITHLDPDRRSDATTVTVMLTPRYDKVRPWDTTLFAHFGERPLDDDELESMRRLWNNPQNFANEAEIESSRRPSDQ
ncbi:hypothetical protein [Mycobacterium sp. D16R24]|uniref:hypothetical protein n=1 Tax=Mycobacterium sp. D16R24 TaxID=1855656 RepID=UPI000993F0C7|nr:hypothetical protein [Mycobacterium sp. D16R24]